MAKTKVKGNDQTPPDYELLEYDINVLPIVRLMDGELDSKQLKSVLHLMGLDVNKPFTKDILADGEVVGYRSKTTGQVVYAQHSIYNGYERTDHIWVKHGQDNAHKYLCGSGMNELLKLFKGE